MKSLRFRQGGGIHTRILSMGFAKTLSVILFPFLVGLIMLRNDHSLLDDMYCLFIFISSVAVWWYLVNRKRTPHA